MLDFRAVLAASAIVLLVTPACSGSSSGPVSVDSVQLAKDDGNGSNGTTVTEFHPKDGTMHCVATLNHAENGSKVSMTFIAVDAGGQKNTPIQTVDLTTNAVENTADGKLTLPRPWPVGKYQCAVTLNGKPAKTVDYSVTEGS